MNKTKRTALLIDADNVSTDVLLQILERLEADGHLLQHRRAYGSVQKAHEFAELAKDHAIRFLPSTFAGPNATDLALAIDAVELVLRQPIDEVVLVSSDRDFAPLIVRLRELGCRVTGFGQQGKSAANIERDYKRVYDDYTVIGAKPAAARSAARHASAPAPTSAPAPAPTQKPAARKAAAKTRRASAAKAAPAPAPMPVPPPEPPALPDAVTKVLDACPELRRGDPVRLDSVAKALRGSGALTKTGRPSALFKKLGAHFEMLPADKPETVRWFSSAR